MRLPIQAQAVGYVSMARVMEGGITPSAEVCSPCVLGKQVCCHVGWPPWESGCDVRDCGFCTPCLPFINKKYCTDTGWQPC
jgi:hypothetical protein